LRFLLDNDVAVAVRRVLIDAGHECWTAAEANSTTRRTTPSPSTPRIATRPWSLTTPSSARRRRQNTIGRHVWLRCTEPRAAAVLNQHLAEVVGVLGRMSDVVIEVRPDSLAVAPPQWE
jgi:hypothetical protein